MICPRCAESNSETARFCQKCGEPFNVVIPTAALGETEPEPTSATTPTRPPIATYKPSVRTKGGWGKGKIALVGCGGLILLCIGISAISAIGSALQIPEQKVAAAVAAQSSQTAVAVKKVEAQAVTDAANKDRTATAEARPTNTPRPAPTAVVKAPPTATPPGFGTGQKIVGTDIEPGTYRSMGASGCYWARLKGFGGSVSEILANDNASGPAVVTIGDDDVGFTSTRCGQWSDDLSAITKGLDEPFGDGTFIVGTDIGPGRWRSSSASGCYYARVRNFSGGVGEIIANDNATGQAIVQIAATDKGFKSSRCGTWTKIG